MTNVNTFKDGDKVRCVDNSDIGYFIVGKEYELLSVSKYGVQIIDDAGVERHCTPYYFEPVVEPAAQDNDGLDSTPCETRTVTEFEVGDKVYCSLLDCIETVKEVINDRILFSVNGEYMSISTCCYATQENYEMLCKLYPHNHFEKPLIVLKGSDLCRAMLERGDKYVPCYVSDVSEEEAEEGQCEEFVTSFKNGEFISNYDWQYAIPFDPRTGEVLTAEQAGV